MRHGRIEQITPRGRRDGFAAGRGHRHGSISSHVSGRAVVDHREGASARRTTHAGVGSETASVLWAAPGISRRRVDSPAAGRVVLGHDARHIAPTGARDRRTSTPSRHTAAARRRSSSRDPVPRRRTLPTPPRAPLAALHATPPHPPTHPHPRPTATTSPLPPHLTPPSPPPRKSFTERERRNC